MHREALEWTGVPELEIQATLKRLKPSWGVAGPLRGAPVDVSEAGGPLVGTRPEAAPSGGGRGAEPPEGRGEAPATSSRGEHLQKLAASFTGESPKNTIRFVTVTYPPTSEVEGSPEVRPRLPAEGLVEGRLAPGGPVSEEARLLF